MPKIQATTHTPPPRRTTQQKPKTPLGAKVARVALWIFFTLTAVAFMLYQPPLFFTGLIIGIIFKAQMQQAIDKIKLVWKQQPWATLGVGALASVLAFPVVLITGAALMGGYLGIRFAKRGEDIQAKTAPAA